MQRLATPRAGQNWVLQNWVEPCTSQQMPLLTAWELHVQSLLSTMVQQCQVLCVNVRSPCIKKLCMSCAVPAAEQQQQQQ
jgi:hypothetical protein